MDFASQHAPLDSKPGKDDVSHPDAKRVSLSIPTTSASQSVAKTKFTQAEHAFVLTDSTESTRFVIHALKVFTTTSRLWNAGHCAGLTPNTETVDATADLGSS